MSYHGIDFICTVVGPIERLRKAVQIITLISSRQFSSHCTSQRFPQLHSYVPLGFWNRIRKKIEHLKQFSCSQEQMYYSPPVLGPLRRLPYDRVCADIKLSTHFVSQPSGPQTWRPSLEPEYRKPIINVKYKNSQPTKFSYRCQLRELQSQTSFVHKCFTNDVVEANDWCS